MSPITTHVLDTATGQPATGLSVILERLEVNRFIELARGVTNGDGRLVDWWSVERMEIGQYRIRFETEAYFIAGGHRDYFYPEVIVHFEAKEGIDHYHVPLLLSPFGYSTYRGS